MNLREIVEKAANNVGGPKALADKIGCDPAVITRAKSGTVPPWVADACAEIAGADREIALLEAHAATSRSDAESEHWRRRLRQLRGVLAAIMFIAVPFYSGTHSSIAEARNVSLATESAWNIHYAPYKTVAAGVWADCRRPRMQSLATRCVGTCLATVRRIDQRRRRRCSTSRSRCFLRSRKLADHPVVTVPSQAPCATAVSTPWELPQLCS